MKIILNATIRVIKPNDVDWFGMGKLHQLWKNVIIYQIRGRNEVADKDLYQGVSQLQTMSGSKVIQYITSFFLPLLVLLTSIIVFIQYGFEGSLARDDALYMYSGQQMANGIPPYVSIFNHTGPLAPMISSIGVRIATYINVDDIFTVRIIFFMFGCLSVVGLYLLGSILFESRRIGLLAALVFIGFWGFGRYAASGPRLKTLVVFFEILSLLFMVHNKWFLAALCGSLTFLAWQPTLIYPMIAIFLAVTQSKKRHERARNAIRAVSGALTPILIVSMYFLYKGALYDLIDGAIFFNIFHLERGTSSVLSHILRPIRAIYYGYTIMMVPIFLGGVMVFILYVWRWRLHRGSISNMISEDRFAAILLSFPALIIWSLLDFQWYPDFYVFLPYVAIGFGWLLGFLLTSLSGIKGIGPNATRICFLLICTVLIGSASMNYRFTSENGIERQRQWAQQVESQWGHESKLVSIGRPEILVLLHRTNPNPYVFIINGIDNHINANTLGGFTGWLEELEMYNPSVIALGPTRGRFTNELMSWLKIHYRKTKVGNWVLFVK